MDTITRMQAFIAVVDTGGFSAAARQTGRSKALMSKYVSELEEELGARLLNRTTRQVSLTEAGAAAYEEAQEMMRQLYKTRKRAVLKLYPDIAGEPWFSPKKGTE